MLPIRKTVSLSRGHVTLHAWPATTADGHLLDLLTLSVTLGQMREEWFEHRRGDLEPRVWGTFWRLVNASLGGAELPGPLTWGDRLTLLEAMYELNDVEAAEGKLTALLARAQRMLERLSRARPTERWTNT